MSSLPAQATVLVLGANGRFGQAAVQAFAAAGWRVLAQMRRTPAAPLPAGAEAVTLALGDTDGLSRAAAGARAVVYAVNPAYTRWTKELLPLARQGLAVAERLGALFMLPGNVYNYGSRMPALLGEQSPQHPDTEKGRLRCELEDLLSRRAADGHRSVVIRAGDFYGCGTGSWLDLMIAKSISSGKLVYPGPLDVPHAWAYLPDLARAFVAVAARDDGTALRRLHFAGHTLTGSELLAALERAAHALGLRPDDGWRRGRWHWNLVALAGVFWPTGRELWRLSYLWRVPHALDGHSLAQAVGPLPATAVDTTFAQALRDLGHGPRAAPQALTT
jgi:nucleoside-diphosphate-sugar epimerase